MADENQEIKIIITADGSVAARAMGDVSNASKQMGGVVEDSHGKATAGVKGLQFAAKGLAHEFGIGGPMARYFGHEVGDLTSSLGGAALAVGVVSLAVMAAYKIYEHLAESTKKASDESLKAAEASMNWVEAARVETTETDNLRKAKDGLWQVEKDRNIMNLERGIKEETKLIEEQFKKIDEVARRARTGTDSGSSGLYIMLYGKKATREKEFEDLQLELRTNMEKLAVMKADLEIALGKDTLKRKVKETPAEDTPWSSAYIVQIANAIRATQELERAKEEAAQNDTALNVQEMHNMEAAQTKRVEMLNRQRIYLAARTKMAIEADDAEKKSAEKLAQEKQRLNQLVMNQAIGVGADLLTFALTSGKKNAEAVRRDAKTTAYVSTIAGIARALKDYSWPYSLIVGGLVAASGFAQVARIDREDDSGGGASIGAGGGLNGSPDNNYRYWNYEQSNYGSGWRPGQGQGAGSTAVTIYAMDSKSMEQYFNDNPASAKVINKVVQRQQQGYA